MRRGDYLTPHDVMADDELRSIPEGKQVLISIKTPRNPRHHRLLWALLKKVTDNSDLWATPTEFLNDLKIVSGLTEKRYSHFTGEEYRIPKSISFSSMSQKNFDIWFSRAIYIIARDVLKCLPNELEAEILAMIGEKKDG